MSNLVNFPRPTDPTDLVELARASTDAVEWRSVAEHFTELALRALRTGNLRGVRVARLAILQAEESIDRALEAGERYERLTGAAPVCGACGESLQGETPTPAASELELELAQADERDRFPELCGGCREAAGAGA